ncbi:MAG: DUF481 domain-containing protein [Planctomycetota bacterium]
MRRSSLDGARTCFRAAAVVSLLTFAASCTSVTQSLDPLKGDAQDAPLPAQTDPVPEPTTTIDLDDGKDWIQLKSGEWLRGEIVRIRDESMDFDSDELDDQSIDLGDIKRIVSNHEVIILTADGRELRGTLAVEEENVWVIGESTSQIRREDVLTLLALNESGDSTNWSGGLSLGLTARSGNTDQTDYSAIADLARETARTRWYTRYTGALSNINQTETANNHRIGSTYAINLTQRLFVTAPGIDLFSDRFQNIGLRVTPYAALGYDLFTRGAHSWAVSLGPALQYQRLDSPGPGEEREETTGAVLASSNYSWDITSDVEFTFDYSITAPVPETDRYNHNFVMQFSVDLLGDLDLDVTFIWDRVNKPQLDADGNLPEADDFRTTVGLGWSF